MPTWNAHSLADKTSDPLDLGKGDKVKASVDLPGVPAGTAGEVALANGFIWKRFWVRFDNGVTLGSLDSHQLEPVAARKKR
ncbi:MAG: hypothetical protein QOG03_2544 [Actinomycetota bacterium]|jgi:hypothetical protein|nr:hypothetical protein [Actinomycetota bacterium]